MPSAETSMLVVLSANRALFDHVSIIHRGLAVRGEPLDIEWMPDPVQLVEARTRVEGTRIVAVVLDLTVQQTPVRATAPARRQRERLRMDGFDDAGFAWQIAAMVAVIGGDDRIPLLLVSENHHLDQLTSRCGCVMVRRVEPRASDDVWKEALSDLLVVTLRDAHSLDDDEDLSRLVHQTDSSARLVGISPGVQIDLDRWIVLAGDRQLMLTPQEIRVLNVLLHAPGHFYSSDELARRTTKLDGYPADDHCIRQTICGLRQKLGDTGTNPRLLVNRRGLGYALVLNPSVHSTVRVAAHAVPAHVVSS